MAEETKFQRDMGLAILREWCQTEERGEVFTKWRKKNGEPKSSAAPLSILHFNIRSFYSNQHDLAHLINKYKPTIISLNELGTIVLQVAIEKLLFEYNIFMKEGSNPHGGAVLAVDKRLKATPIASDQPNLVAVSVITDKKPHTIVSVYSPPTEPLPLDALSSMKTKSNSLIITGDMNAKHQEWGCAKANKKGHELAGWINKNELAVQNANMKTSLRSETTIDLIITEESESNVECRALANSGSDHLPILAEIHGTTINSNEAPITKTYWNVYEAILTTIQDEIAEKQAETAGRAQDRFEWLQQLLSALKQRVTVWHKKKKERATLPPSIRILLKHKHHLQNVHRHSKLEEDRLRLRSWQKLVQSEVRQFKASRWNTFISNVASPNPANFWKTIKSPNKKRAVSFSAVTEGNIVHKSSDEIIKCLHKHFSTRFTPPSSEEDSDNDREAQEAWNEIQRTEPDRDVQQRCNRSTFLSTGTGTGWKPPNRTKPTGLPVRSESIFRDKK